MTESLEFYMVAQELARETGCDVYLFERESDGKNYAVATNLVDYFKVCTAAAEPHKYALGWVLADDNGKPIIADRTSILEYGKTDPEDWHDKANYAYLNLNTSTDECTFYCFTKKPTKYKKYDVIESASKDGYLLFGIIREEDATWTLQWHKSYIVGLNA